jgi:hypothetical protein
MKRLLGAWLSLSTTCPACWVGVEPGVAGGWVGSDTLLSFEESGWVSLVVGARW